MEERVCAQKVGSEGEHSRRQVWSVLSRFRSKHDGWGSSICCQRDCTMERQGELRSLHCRISTRSDGRLSAALFCCQDQLCLFSRSSVYAINYTAHYWFPEDLSASAAEAVQAIYTRFEKVTYRFFCCLLLFPKFFYETTLIFVHLNQSSWSCCCYIRYLMGNFNDGKS